MGQKRPDSMLFTDAAEASAYLSSAYAPVRLAPLSKGEFRLEISGTVLPGTQVYATDCLFGARFLSAGYFDGFTFSSMKKGMTAVKSGSTLHRVSNHTGLAIDAETVERLEMSQQGEFRSFAISANEMQAALSDRLCEHASRRIRFRAESFGGRLALTCRKLSDVIAVEMAPDGTSVDSPLALRNLQDALTNLVLFGTEHSYSSQLSRELFEPPTIVGKALDYIHAHAHLPISTAEIARDLGVGLRSLQIAFQKNLNTTPNRYLRDVRLLNARTDLLAGDHSVAQVAQKWGFFWSGEFSRLYQQKFGEKPSETLRNTRL